MAFAYDVFSGHRYDGFAGAPKARRIAMRHPSADERLAAWEFGPAGRDPRYPAGWYILPSVLAMVLLLTLVL